MLHVTMGIEDELTLNLEALDMETMRRNGKVQRKDALGTDETIRNIFQKVSEGENPFEVDLEFDPEELGQAKLMRAGIKVIAQNPEILNYLDATVGVENL